VRRSLGRQPLAVLLRSVAVYRVVRTNWLYGGAVIASLTASTILSTSGSVRLLEKCSISSALRHRPGRISADARLRGGLPGAGAERTRDARGAPATGYPRAVASRLAQLGSANWRSRLAELAAPVACMLAYLVFTGSGIQEQAIRT